MRNFLIDIGNSNIKTAISIDNKIFKVKRYNYSKEKFSKILNDILIYKKNYFESIGISCLNKNYKKIIDNKIKKKYSIKPLFVKFENNLPIKLEYEKTLGADRISSAVAAALKYKNKKNILVIDFGTATTYNLICNKTFKGGIITPGLLTSLHSLKLNANLPFPRLRNNFRLISKKTNTNILSGVMYQSIFTTENIIKILKEKYSDLYVISTGGLAEFIYKKSCLIDKNEKNLVLEGINYIIKHKIK